MTGLNPCQRGRGEGVNTTLCGPPGLLRERSTEPRTGQFCELVINRPRTYDGALKLFAGLVLHPTQGRVKDCGKERRDAGRADRASKGRKRGSCSGSEDGVNEDAIGRKPMTEFLPPAFDQPRGQAADQPYLDTTAYGSGPDDSITDVTEAAAITHHVMTIGGVSIAYTATAGHLVAVDPVSSSRRPSSSTSPSPGTGPQPTCAQ